MDQANETGAEHLTRLAGGAFFGNGLNRVELEWRLAAFWRPRQTEVEIERIGQTWFDYRFAHPVLRSHFFYHAYTLAWRRAWRRFYDSEADVSRVVPWGGRRLDLYAHRSKDKEGRSRPSATIYQTIDVMHFADELCMPYGVFLDAGFEHLMQERGFTTVWKTKSRGLEGAKLPPVRLFRDGQVAIAAQTRFERLTERRLIHATHPSYRVSNWSGLPWQEEHMRWLVNDVRRRGRGIPEALRVLVYDRDVLSETMVARVFGIDMVKRLRGLRDAC